MKTVLATIVSIATIITISACGGSGSKSNTINNQTKTNKEIVNNSYSEFQTIAKNIALQDCIYNKISGHSIKLYTDDETDIKTVSKDAYVLIGKLNGEKYSFQVNRNYDKSKAKFIAKIYDSSGKLVKTTPVVSLEKNPYANLGEITVN